MLLPLKRVPGPPVRAQVTTHLQQLRACHALGAHVRVHHARHRPQAKAPDRPQVRALVKAPVRPRAAEHAQVTTHLRQPRVCPVQVNDLIAATVQIAVTGPQARLVANGPRVKVADRQIQQLLLRNAQAVRVQVHRVRVPLGQVHRVQVLTQVDHVQTQA